MSIKSADPFGDKRRKETAQITAKFKKGAGKARKVRTKPIKISIQSASITDPKGMKIEKNMIMPKMAKEGGLMTQGNLRDAIAKVKAKEMQGGGEAKSGGKAVSINTPTGRRKMAEIRKIMPGASVDEVKEFGLKSGILKMKDGGGVTKGKSIKAKISKKGVPAQSGKPLAKGQKIIMIDDIPITSKKEGGEAVPAKFKGFSKLPEEVQKKMDPALAERFEDGGPVKMGSGGGVCKGMGIARAGGKFKVR